MQIENWTTHVFGCKQLFLTERGNGKSDVIVNDLVLLWQPLITPTGYSPSQQHHLLYVTITVRKWCSGRAAAVRHRGLISIRLILYKPDSPVSLQHRNRPQDWAAGLVPTVDQHKPKDFPFFQRVWSIDCAAEVAPTEGRRCKLLFYTLSFQEKKEKTSNGEYIKHSSRSLWSGFECNELTWH